MDRSKARDLMKQLEDHLQLFAKEHGIVARVGHGSFSGANLTVKVELAEVGDDGQAQTREVQDFKRHCGMYGLKETDLGRTFMSQGRTFKIVGCSSNSPKFPIFVQEVSTGKSFKFPAKTVQTAIMVENNKNS